MLPAVNGALLLQVGHQLLSHADDTISHPLYLLQPVEGKKKKVNTFTPTQNRDRGKEKGDGSGVPLAAQLWLSQDCCCYPCPIQRRVGVHGTNKDLQLRLHSFCFFSIAAHHSESTNTFTWREGGSLESAEFLLTQNIQLVPACQIYSAASRSLLYRVRIMEPEPCSWQILAVSD